MTLALLVMRHGKSDWTADHATDADRPLSSRGRRAAKRVGRFLTATGQQPDLAVTSPARRACQTLELASRAGAWTCQTTTSQDLAERWPGATFQFLRRGVPAGIHIVLVVGHEPTLSEVIEIATGATVRFPTAAVARIELDLPAWESLAAGTGRLAWLLPPRLLKAMEP